MSKNESRTFLRELTSDHSFRYRHGWCPAGSSADGRSGGGTSIRSVPSLYAGGYVQHPSFDEFLGFVTAQLDESTAHGLAELRADFVRGMTNSYAVFGQHAFRKWPTCETRRNPINRALFESWGTVLAAYDEDVVESNAAGLAERARNMMTHDYDFINAISGSTGAVRNVRTRLDKVRSVAAEVLQ